MTAPIRIATRGSRLALWQANYVGEKLRLKGYPSVLKIIKTEGDIVQDRFLHEIGGKGLFVRELEQALVDNVCDIAVHSLKDLPARTPAPFCLAAILERHRSGDVLIMKPEFSQRLGGSQQQVVTAAELQRLPNLCLATASLRRQSLLRQALPKARLEPVRGNVDTRIEKLRNGNWDAIVLASASVERLSLDAMPWRELDPEWFVPAPAQGALAIETLSEHPLRSLIAELGCPETTAHVRMEREVLAILGGDCTMPFGAFIRFDPTTGFTVGQALVLSTSGREARFRHKAPGPWHLWKPENFVNALVRGLMDQGAESILRELAITVPDLGKL